MKNKFYFNNEELKRNKHLINYIKSSKCPKRNIHFFIKHFCRLEIPNLNKLSLSQNVFISTEENTIITTEDYYTINKNDCKCICHNIDKKLIIHNNNKNLYNSCNCPCHLYNKSMINYSNIFNTIYQNKPKQNYIQRVCKSADNINNTNNDDFNLIDKYTEYEDLNKKYIDIKKQIYNFESEKKERNTYIKKFEHNLYIYSGEEYNEYEKNNCFYRNYSNSDINIKYNHCLYNRSFNNLLEKTKNILNSPSFSNLNNRNKNYNVYSPNLSYSYYNEKRNAFYPFFENNKNKRYLSHNSNYLIKNQDKHLFKNKNPIQITNINCIRNKILDKKDIGESILFNEKNRENIKNNYFIIRKDSLKLKNINNNYKLNRFSNNDLIKSFENRYSHYSLDETIHSTINKNSHLSHPKSFGKNEINRNIYFFQNSENNKNKNKQKRIGQYSNIMRIGNDIIFEESEKNPFKTKGNEYYCIQKVNNIIIGSNKENNNNNELIKNKNDTNKTIICEINFNIINDNKKKISKNKNYLDFENIKFNNKSKINTNIIDNVDNFIIFEDNNLQIKCKLKSYKKVYDNMKRDNIISFNISKNKNHKNKYDKKKFIDNKKEIVNNINIFPSKKNKIPSKKKSAKDNYIKMEEKRNNNINKIIEKILSKNNKKDKENKQKINIVNKKDKVNKQKNNIKKPYNKNVNKEKDINKKKILPKKEELNNNPSIDSLLNYSLNDSHLIKKSDYHFNINDGDININKQINQKKPTTNNNKIKIEFQKSLEYQSQNNNNINFF